MQTVSQGAGTGSAVTLYEHEPIVVRRAKQYERLLALLGVQSTLVALNMIDQVGIEKPEDRCEVVDALIASIEKGQAWATGEMAIEIVQCPVCEGTGHSKSARGRCRACRGFGRCQVKCRVCAELEPVKRMQSTCVDCLSVGELDPKTQRDVILRQHREWWERMTKMRTDESEDNGGIAFGALRRGEAIEVFAEKRWRPALFAEWTEMTGLVVAEWLSDSRVATTSRFAEMHVRMPKEKPSKEEVVDSMRAKPTWTAVPSKRITMASIRSARRPTTPGAFRSAARITVRSPTRAGSTTLSGRRH